MDQSDQTRVEAYVIQFPERRPQYERILRDVTPMDALDHLAPYFIQEAGRDIFERRASGEDPPEFPEFVAFVNDEFEHDYGFLETFFGFFIDFFPDPLADRELATLLGPRVRIELDKEWDWRSDPDERAFIDRVCIEVPHFSTLGNNIRSGRERDFISTFFMWAAKDRLVANAIENTPDKLDETKQVLAMFENEYGKTKTVDRLISDSFLILLPDPDEPGYNIVELLGPKLTARHDRVCSEQTSTERYFALYPQHDTQRATYRSLDKIGRQLLANHELGHTSAELCDFIGFVNDEYGHDASNDRDLEIAFINRLPDPQIDPDLAALVSPGIKAWLDKKWDWRSDPDQRVAVNRLVATFPQLQPLIDGHTSGRENDILPSPFMVTVNAHLAKNVIANTPDKLEETKQILNYIENQHGNNENADFLIESSFLGVLPRFYEPGYNIVELLGPKLEAAYRRQWNIPDNQPLAIYDFEDAISSLEPWPGQEVVDRVVHEICVVHNDAPDAAVYQRRLLWMPNLAIIETAARELTLSGDVNRFALIFDVLSDEVALPELGMIPDSIYMELAPMLHDDHFRSRLPEMLRQVMRDFDERIAEEAKYCLSWLGLPSEGPKD